MNATPTIETSIEPHAPHWLSRAAFPVLVVLFFLTQASLGFAVYRANYWLAAPLVLISSHLMHGMLIGFHEASHGLLRKSRLLNEVDGIIIGIFSLMSFSLYRAAHQLHHAYLASERDEELWPFVHPQMPRGARVLALCSNSRWDCCSRRFFSCGPSSARFAHSEQEIASAHLDGVRGHGGRLDCDPDGGRGLRWLEIFPLAASHPGVAGREHAKPSQVCGARRPHRLDGEQLDAQHRGGGLGGRVRQLHAAPRAVSRRPPLALRAAAPGIA
jgi:hypothetical protein